MMCRVLKVSESGYHAWRTRPASARARADLELTQRIRLIHEISDGTYGSPNIYAELKDDGVRVGRKRVARLMRQAGIVGVTRRKVHFTTVVDGSPVAPDLVERHFEVSGPNQLWVADITYVPTQQGFLYLAIIIDAWSRRVVGWAMSKVLDAEIAESALKMALSRRKPKGVIHHSDHGCQYTSLQFGRRCREAGIRLSMGSVGDAYDNAMAESFFASLKCELVDRYDFATRAAAELAIFKYVEGWYNPRRRHSALRYQSPVTFEARAAA
jgi:putative transposase